MKIKKILAAVVLAIGCASVSTIYATPIPQVCDTTKPCAYTGVAKTSDGKYSINIKVYQSDNGKWVATFSYNGENYTMYVIDDGDGRCHVNFNGKAYYFNI